MNNFAGVSKNEIVWVQHIRNEFPVYLTTSDKNREVYYLYKYSEKESKYIKINHQSSDPIKLEEKYIKDTKYNKADNNEIIKNKATFSNVIDSSGIEEMNTRNIKENTINNTKRDRHKKKVNTEPTKTITNPDTKKPNIKSNIKPNIKKKGKLF